MKVLVYFTHNKHQINYEGDRLRKTIIGALNSVDIEYTTNPVDKYDVAHFISVDDEIKASDATNEGIPVVFSSLMCESDPAAMVTEDKNGETKLTAKALRVLNKADTIIVPTKQSASFLLESGITKDISVLPCGVNIDRFDYSKTIEKELFWRYIQVEKNENLVIAVGEYDNMDGIATFDEIARKCPNALFVFFGQSKNWFTLSGKIKKLIRHRPKNVRFYPIVPGDVYRSAMLNAKAFLLPGYNIAGAVTIMDAMASKTQIIARKRAVFADALVNGETAYLGETNTEIIDYIKKYIDGEIPSTTEKAYEYAKSASLYNIGKELKWIYQSLLNLKN